MRPLLDLRHLQLIQAIIETGRITDAAEKLGVTPSALSHRLREAERRLDVPLFTRMHKRLRKTPAADPLLGLPGGLKTPWQAQQTSELVFSLK